jgi:hypothetical membrane protein
MFVARPRIPESVGPVASTRACLLAMAAVGLVGGGLAVDRSTVDLLTLPTISRLGIDGRAGVILNVTLIGLGLSLLALGLCFRKAFAGLPGSAPRPVKDLISAGFAVAGVGLGLTGVFPIETPGSTVVHNLAGFSTPLVLMASLIGARAAFGSLGPGLDAFSVMVVAGNAMLFASASTLRLPSYPIMELACFALIGAWLWLLEVRLRQVSDGLRVLASSSAVDRLP